MIAALVILAWLVLTTWMVGCWWKTEYEGSDDEIIEYTEEMPSGPTENRFVPLYRNKWGKLYYGHFRLKSFYSEWRRVEYYGGFGGDPNLFTMRRIRCYRGEDMMSRSIEKEKARSDRAVEHLNSME